MAEDSLILRAQDQMELIPTSQMPDDLFFVPENSTLGEFTGERFFARRPDDYHRCVSMLAENIPVISIARLLRVSPNTVRAVREREGMPIDQEKKRLAGLMMDAQRLAVERVLEDLTSPEVMAKTSTKDKALVAAVMHDKAAMYRGEATTRVDVVTTKPAGHDDFNAFIQSVSGPVIDVESMDCEAATPAQKGAAAPARDPGPLPGPLPGLPADPTAAPTDLAQAPANPDPDPPKPAN